MTMTWYETWLAIKQGDVGVILATAIEISVMTSPIIILVGARYSQP